MKYVQKQFWKEHLCALKVFLCALVSRPVWARTRAQLRGNIACLIRALFRNAIYSYIGQWPCGSWWLRL